MFPSVSRSPLQLTYSEDIRWRAIDLYAIRGRTLGDMADVLLDSPYTIRKWIGMLSSFTLDFRRRSADTTIIKDLFNATGNVGRKQGRTR